MAFSLFSRRKDDKLDLERLPQHIAIIMDGNGRWARKRGLPRSAGHSAGAKTFRMIAEYCRELGIRYLTVYALSTENVRRRPTEELEGIRRLLDEYLLEALEKIDTENMVFNFLGDLSFFDEEMRKKMEILSHKNRDKADAITLNLCLNYGGRDEIVRAAQALCDRAARGLLERPLTEEDLSAGLYTAGQPDPDLIIRPSGEQRLSNFLIWQAAYAEFWYSNVLWPDFGKAELRKALLAYQNRNRRFGGV